MIGIGSRDAEWGAVRADADSIALLMRDGWSVTVDEDDATEGRAR